MSADRDAQDTTSHQVSGGERILRRIPPMHFVKDKNTKEVRPSSAAFKDNKRGPMSVYLTSIIARIGRKPSDALHGNKDFGLVAIPAATVEGLGLEIVPDPIEGEDAQPCDAAHAVVEGNKTHSKRDALVRASEWVVPPPEPDEQAG